MSALTDKLANLNTVMDQSIVALNAKASEVQASVAALNQQIIDLQAQIAAGGEVTEADIDALAVKASQIMTAINAIPPVQG